MFDGVDDGTEPLVVNDKYASSFELKDGYLFGHIDIYDESLTTMKEIKRNWEFMKKIAFYEGFNQLLSYTKNKRFIEFLGGAQHVTTVEDEDQGTYEVYKWELLQSS